MTSNQSDLETPLWSAVEELRASSGLKFDNYATLILGLILLGYANQRSQPSSKHDGSTKGTIAVPLTAQWAHLLPLPKQALGTAVNDAMRAIESENEHLKGALPRTYDRLQDSTLADLIQVFSRISDEAEVGTFSSAYEFFLDQFARASGHRSGEFFTPREVTTLLIELVKPQGGMSVYDPCLGTGGLLREASRYVAGNSKADDPSLSLFGQEINEETLSIAKMHLAINGELDADLRRGNTLTDPLHTTQVGLMQFDRVVANPPFAFSLHGDDLEHDPFNRFRYGIPPRNNADFAFIQHMIASLKPDAQMSVIAPHGVLFRGGRESKIRQGILEEDLLEAVIGLPPALFYLTEISAAILVINKNKCSERVGKVLFINADQDFQRERRHNSLRPEDVLRITTTFNEFSDIERYSKVVDLDEIRANSFNLNIPRYADSSALAGLVTQYDNFEKHSIKELAVEINSVRRGGRFEDMPNSVYISLTGRQATDCLDDLPTKHNGYYQIILNEKAISSYVAQFLGTSVGRHALSLLAVGSVIQRLSKSDLQECIIALPGLAKQDEIVLTHKKLSSLKEAINDLDRELSLNPTALSEFEEQLDSMLNVMGALSEADHLRSIIRQGESKTVEFKETFSLDVRKDAKEKYIEEASLKTVVAFLNSDGGVLLVGVNDDGKFVGIDVELERFHKCIADNFLLHFKNSVRSRIGEEFYPLIDYRIVEAEERKMLIVECKRSERPCFLDAKTFYVRTNPATDKLEGAKLYEYMKSRFDN